MAKTLILSIINDKTKEIFAFILYIRSFCKCYCFLSLFSINTKYQHSNCQYSRDGTGVFSWENWDDNVLIAAGYLTTSSSSTVKMRQEKAGISFCSRAP